MKNFGITFAALLLVVALTIVLSATEVLPRYLIAIIISWQALIVLAGCKTLLLRSYLWGAFIVILGSYFLVPKIYSVVGVAMPLDKVTWNGIIIALGLVILAIASVRVSKWIPKTKGLFNLDSSNSGAVQVSSAFGEIEHTIIERPYSGIKTASAFGQLTLDMTKTTLKEGDSYLDVSNAFGATIIVVPSDWSVTSSVQSFIGSIKDSRYGKPVATNKRLIIRGANALGEIEIVSKAVENSETAATEETLESISVKHNNRVVIISLEQLLYIQADGDYVTLCTAEGNFLKEQTMKYFQTALPADRFVRIHRSYIVNIAEIISVDNRGREVYYVTLKNGTALRASSSGYQELKQHLEL